MNDMILLDFLIIITITLVEFNNLARMWKRGIIKIYVKNDPGFGCGA